MKHANAKGYKPRIRPYFWNDKKGVSVIKVMRAVPRKAWQLAMRKLGVGFVEMRDGRLEPACSFANDLIQEELICVETGHCNTESWYVDTSGYGMLQANDAEPPPKQGWLCRVLQCAAVVLFGAMLFTGPTSCNKDPQPTPGPTPDTITPIDTITPVNPVDTVNPGDTITPVVFDTVELPIKINNITGVGIIYPTQDTIRKLLAMDKIIILKWYVPPNVTSGWTPDVFRFPRDSLKVRFAMSDKIVGDGKIYVNKNYRGGGKYPV